jgi:hypothetical protein
VGLDAQTIQPAASCYSNCDIPTHCITSKKLA